jgi:lysophospholipase L1-like esterase
MLSAAGRRALLTVLASAAALAPAGAAAAASRPEFNQPKPEYLALGDSITYGFQNSKFAAGLPAKAYDTGYVDVLADRLRQLRRGLVAVNYGCPGESAASFSEGFCPWAEGGFELHDDFTGAQLDAAVTFLRARGGKVSPITLNLAGNDINELISACGGDLTCVQVQAPAAIAQFAERLRVILVRLRTAAPRARIIVVGAWHTFLSFIPQIDALFAALNAAMASTAAQARARFADLSPVFNPPGEAARVAAVCSLTSLCVDGDGHPSDAGYRAIADVVLEASGYVDRR